MKARWPLAIAFVLLIVGFHRFGVAQGTDSTDDMFWKSVRKADLEEEYRLYLSQYPKGKYADDALRRIRHFEALAEANRRAKGKLNMDDPGRQAKPPNVGIGGTEKADPEEFGLGRIFTACDDCPTMVVVPQGSFEMGARDGYIDEKPIRRVYIPRPFAIARTEVTQGQWLRIMGTNPSKFSSCGKDCPVEQVNWIDAQEFVRRLSERTGKPYRLPSEAEWEYACRAGRSDNYCGGDDVEALGWHSGNSSSRTHPVATKKSNQWGLYDMSGNVSELVADCWNESYRGAPVNADAWSSGDCGRRGIRGGSWVGKLSGLRASGRNRGGATLSDPYTGFRVCMSLP